MTDLRLRVNDAELVADASGAIYWPDRRLLALADLHLEKGSAFAMRGRFLPPYDSAATIDRLAAVLGRHRPRQVLCLGDSFHDRAAAGRLPAADRARLAGLVAAVDWCWIAGNHDPDPPAELGGRCLDELALDGLRFRHDAVGTAGGAVAGHLHPVAAVRTAARRIRARCFATDGLTLVLPAFGAYAGGLNVLDPGFERVLRPGFAVYLLAGARVRAISRGALLPD